MRLHVCTCYFTLVLPWLQACSGLIRAPMRMDLRVYSPKDLQITRFLGEQGVITITDWEYYGGKANPLDPNQPARTWDSSGTKVRLFAGKAGTVKLLLKEFYPDVTSLRDNELKIQELLQAGWEEYGGPSGDFKPFQNLLGLLSADSGFKDPRFIERWVSKFSTIPPPSPGNQWLIYQWEQITNFSTFPQAKQEQEFWDILSSQAKFIRRGTFVKTMLYEALVSLSFLHGALIAHRSLGPTSLLTTTQDERYPNQLRVQISDLGFATRLSEISKEDVARAQKFGASGPLDTSNFLIREDLYALGYVFLELIFAALTLDPDDPKSGGGARQTDANYLKKLIEDIYQKDVSGRFREYCAAEACWAPVVGFLDQGDGDGWELIEVEK
ncbi:unnamed protein product [Chrysoparadoxa australica]